MRLCVIGTVPKANGKAGSQGILLKIGKFRRKSDSLRRLSKFKSDACKAR